MSAASRNKQSGDSTRPLSKPRSGLPVGAGYSKNTVESGGVKKKLKKPKRAPKSEEAWHKRVEGRAGMKINVDKMDREKPSCEISRYRRDKQYIKRSSE